MTMALSLTTLLTLSILPLMKGVDVSILWHLKQRNSL